MQACTTSPWSVATTGTKENKTVVRRFLRMRSTPVASVVQHGTLPVCGPQGAVRRGGHPWPRGRGPSGGRRCCSAPPSASDPLAGPWRTSGTARTRRRRIPSPPSSRRGSGALKPGHHRLHTAPRCGAAVQKAYEGCQSCPHASRVFTKLYAARACISYFGDLLPLRLPSGISS